MATSTLSQGTLFENTSPSTTAHPMFLTPSTEDHKSDGPKQLEKWIEAAKEGKRPITSAQRLRNQVLISSRADSPASPSPSRDSNVARRTTVTSGLKCIDLLKNSGPLGFVVKTLVASSQWHSMTCSLTWKPQATKRGRLYFRLAASARGTGGSGHSSSRMMPTLTARDHKDTGVSVVNGTVPVKGLLGRHVQMFPTPKAQNANGPGLHGQGGQDLQTVVTRGLDGTDDGPSTPSGSLNPQFVEWLMGFPLEWTAVDDWYPAYRGGSRDVSRD